MDRAVPIVSPHWSTIFVQQIHPKLSDRSTLAPAPGVALLVLAELAAAEWAPVPLGELALHPFELCALRANASPAAAMDDAELRARCSRRDAGPPALFTLPACLLYTSPSPRDS